MFENVKHDSTVSIILLLFFYEQVHEKSDHYHYHFILVMIDYIIISHNTGSNSSNILFIKGFLFELKNEDHD